MLLRFLRHPALWRSTVNNLKLINVDTVQCDSIVVTRSISEYPFLSSLYRLIPNIQSVSRSVAERLHIGSTTSIRLR